MKPVVIAPDSFKGALGSVEAARAMAHGLNAAWPDLELRLCPMADGGEGTLEAVAAGREGACEWQGCEVLDANGVTRQVAWLELKGEAQATALVEVARVIGLPDARVDVAQRTTLGVGQLIRHLLDCGMRRILIGLGGTSTNDAGCGALAGLGACFRDADGAAFVPTLASLPRAVQVDFSGLDVRLVSTELVLLADVSNPLCGPHGATAEYGPQKGIAADELPAWDGVLAQFAEQGDAWAGRPLSAEKGSGAAGGLAYALMLAGGRRLPGALHIAELVGLRDKLAGAEFVITGEGSSDLQTLMGKTPAAVAECARAAGVPAVLVSGAIDPQSLAKLKRLYAQCHAVSDPALPLAQAMVETARSLEKGMSRILKAYSEKAR